MASSDQIKLIDHYETLNADEHGEYRARKYSRLLGEGDPDSLVPIQPNPAGTPIEELVRQVYLTLIAEYSLNCTLVDGGQRCGGSQERPSTGCG